MARKIEVQIIGDASSLSRAFHKAERDARGFGSKIGSAFAGVAKGAAVAAGAAAAGGLFAVIHEGIKEIKELQQVQAQTSAAIKSTGAVAGVSAKHIHEYAQSLSNLSGIDDEVIQSGENLLLAFTNIRNVAGKNNNIFDRATKSVADFATRTGRDMPTAAIILGRALEDPATKISSLSRAGVVFTKGQREMVAQIQKTQGVMAAQKFILTELEKRYGGAAAAAGKTLPGQLNILRERFKDLSGDLLGVFVPATTRAVTALTDFTKKLAARKGFSAKFDFIVSGLENLGVRIFNDLRDQIARIDVKKVVLRLQAELLKALNGLARVAGQVNWQAVGKQLSAGLAASLGQLATFIRSVDWSKVGEAIVSGIVDFLKSVDWVALFKGIVRLWVASFTALNQLIGGIGKGAGKAILGGLKEAGGELVTFMEKLAIRMVLAFAKHLDFKVLGHTLVPGIGKLIDGLQARLDELNASVVNSAVTSDRADRVLRKPDKSGKGTTSRVAGSAGVPPAKPPTDTTASDAQKKAAGDVKKSSDATKKAAEATRKAAEAAKRAAEAAAQRFADAKDSAASLFGSFFQKPESDTGLPTFLGGSRGTKLVQQPGTSAKDLLAIITAQNKSFAALTGNIAKLAREGAPASLLKAAREGQISADQVAALASADKATRSRIFAQVRRADRLITQAAKAEINAKTVNLRAGTVNVGHAIPGGGFAPRDSGDIVIHHTVNVDGSKIEAGTTRRSKRRAAQRRGRVAGHR